MYNCFRRKRNNHKNEVDEAKKGETVAFTFTNAYGDLAMDFLKTGDIGILYYREPTVVNPDDIIN